MADELRCSFVADSTYRGASGYLRREVSAAAATSSSPVCLEHYVPRWQGLDNGPEGSAAHPAPPS